MLWRASNTELWDLLLSALIHALPMRLLLISATGRPSFNVTEHDTRKCVLSVKQQSTVLILDALLF
jgi:hypothetical protein